MSTQIVVPPMGESVSEATVAKWLKKVGDAVREDEPLVELETDKVTLEVNAAASGVISEIKAQPGSTVGVGAILGDIDADGAPVSSPAASAGRPPPPHRRNRHPRIIPRRQHNRPPATTGRAATRSPAGFASDHARGAQAGRRPRPQPLRYSRLRQGRPRDEGRRDQCRFGARSIETRTGHRAPARNPPTRARAPTKKSVSR